MRTVAVNTARVKRPVHSVAVMYVLSLSCTCHNCQLCVVQVNDSDDEEEVVVLSLIHI